jgi:DNA (cytosine-5)-methyltransferase 1
MIQAGIEVKLGVDVDPACEYPYTANNRSAFLRKSVVDLKADDLEAAFPKRCVRLLAGCAPCQTFSTYNQKASPDDERWRLLRHFARLILEIEPDVITMENVPGLAEQAVFRSFVTRLKKLKFEVDYSVVNCADYGIPQHRHRLVLVASRLGPIRLLTPKQLRVQPRSVRDAIGHLPPIVAGEVCEADAMHQSSALSSVNQERMRASVPGGTWRDWDRDIIARCHKRKTGRTYPSVYGRMHWDRPAPTITTQFFGFGNGRFGHPEQERALSLREGALLQGFPSGYAFVPNGAAIFKKKIGRLIGNAVPVRLGKIIGKSILRHAEEAAAFPRRER